MTLTVNLRVGDMIGYEGHSWKIESITSRAVALVGPAHRRMTTAVESLVTDPAFALLSPPDTTAVDTLGVDLAVAAQLDPAEAERVRTLARHIVEAVEGHPDGKLTGPQVRPVEALNPAYDPYQNNQSQRYAAKAAELGMSSANFRRLVKRHKARGADGLVSGNALRARPLLSRLDQRWVDVARAHVLDQSQQSTKSKQTILRQISLTVETAAADLAPGDPPIRVPNRSEAYRALDDLSKGRSTWGNAKGRRSIANRPQGTFGSLKATRPGELVLLDSTRLDVFAMEPVTFRWVPCELTVAMDLFTRRIVGLKITPRSTRATDISDVIYEVCAPRQPQRPILADHIRDLLQHSAPFTVPDWKVLPGDTSDVGVSSPYTGIPETFIVDADTYADNPTERAAHDLDENGCVPEAVIVDRGKNYVSEHVRSACRSLGISFYPCRAYTPTDKAPVERWFRTLGDFLQNLDGYKGPDVYNRGRDPEAHAYWFIDELEAIIREWVITCYHAAPHDGLILPEQPGLTLTPDQALDIGIARRGNLRLPATPSVLLGFLKPDFRRVHHYGVEIGRLRYDAPCLDPFRNTPGPVQGKYLLRQDPRDVRFVWWQSPDDNTWRRLTWTSAREYPFPFGQDVVAAARALAASNEYQDQHSPEGALNELLRRWSTGNYGTNRERLTALHRSRDLSTALSQLDPTLDDGTAPVAPVNVGALLGDDDSNDMRDDDPTDDLTSGSDEDYYADSAPLIR